MSQDQTKITAFIKKFNGSMDTIFTFHSLSQIAHLFNDLPEINDRVKQVFYHYLNHYDNLKIKKCLDIFEFLTFHSNTQLVKILNDDKFIELLPYALSDDELLEPALNVLKLWADKYHEEKHDMAPIFDCIDGLSAFGIFLPDSYTSKYEGSVLEPPEPVTIQEEKPQPPAENPLATHTKSKILSIIERGQVLRDESKSLLDDNYFQYHSDDFKKELLEGLLGSHRQLALEKSGLKLDNAVDEIKGSIEALFIVLKAQERKLSGMLEKIEKKGNRDDEVESVTSVETNGENYKIVISGAEEKREGEKNGAMTREEFMNYKVFPCKKGIDCPFHNHSEEERNFYESLCPYWHTESDKRRQVEDEYGFTKYFANLCDDLPCCNDSDSCNFSHNFFEKTFHPTNYKKRKCPLKASECPHGKYCTLYHSKQEQEACKFAKSPQNASFASNSGNDSEGSYDDDFQNPIAQFWGKDAIKAREEMDGLTKDFSLPREVIIPFSVGARENIEAVIEKKNREANRLKELEEGPPRKLEMKGNIESKLIVRKSYNDPSHYTTFFNNHPCFNLMPFVMKQGPQESPQEGEQSRGKVKHEEIITDESRQSATIAI